MTIVEERRAITGGVDPHSEVHVAAAPDPVGGLPGTRDFPATSAGHASLLGWLDGFGEVTLIGVEGTGSYGAGLSRHLGKHGGPDMRFPDPPDERGSSMIDKQPTEPCADLVLARDSSSDLPTSALAAVVPESQEVAESRRPDPLKALACSRSCAIGPAC